MVNRQSLNKMMSWFFLGFGLVLIVILFVFRNSLIDFTSKGLQSQLSSLDKSIFADSVSMLFNYSNNLKPYEFTLLEFSAGGCVACKKMEQVLEQIEHSHGSQVNVVVMNMTKKRGLQWGKYYGVIMVPEQIILDRVGGEIFRHTGFISKDDLLGLLNGVNSFHK